MEHYEEVFKRMNKFGMEFNDCIIGSPKYKEIVLRYNKYRNEDLCEGQYMIDAMLKHLDVYNQRLWNQDYYVAIANAFMIVSNNSKYRTCGRKIMDMGLSDVLSGFDIPILRDLLLAARLEYQALKRERLLYKKIEDENSHLHQQVKTLERRIRDTELALMPEPIEYDYELYASRIAPFKQELLISINALKRIINRRYKDHGEPQ